MNCLRAMPVCSLVNDKGIESTFYKAPRPSARVLTLSHAPTPKQEARRHLRAEPHSSNLRKAVKIAGKKLRKVRKAAVPSFFLETRSREGDQAGFYKHLKTMSLEVKRDGSPAYVKDENGVLLKEVELIRDDGSGGCTLSSTPSHRGLTRTSQKALTSGPNHAARSSAHDAGADRRHSLVGERNGCRNG